ncbi:hypothetical protein Bca52824_010436 [Brassica carinata]|uniref:F-box domain-containing protein n=1 Tax=Brassica carinata TaxID=52824 RepID=A0A8X7WBI7_BRACI|nr:hypothetical protein Bca52824_010436 [Brassica carinata]
MKSQRQNDTEVCLTITPLTKLSNSTNVRVDSLPTDLLIEIFSRFPTKHIAKYIARCRCVSKLWSSVFYRPEFTDVLFLTKSSSIPQLLFACQTQSELLFFSSPQPQGPDENPSLVTASYLTRVPFNFSSERFSTINGFLCLRDDIVEGRKSSKMPFICNPSTGQRLPLPKMETVGQKSYFGYDPIGKQYKLLSMTSSNEKYKGNWKEYRVLTLGTEKLSWRRMECCVPHCPVHNEICINGLLYYRANGDGFTKVTMVVCFDFRSEKFSFMKVTENFSKAVDHKATLINYNGKLSSLRWEEPYSLSRRTGSFVLWVLQDSEKHEWSKHVYVLPLLGIESLYFVGVIGTDEVVLSQDYPTNTFYLFYCNIKRNSIVRREIQGIKELNGSRVRTLLNHVENVNLM